MIGLGALLDAYLETYQEHQVAQTPDEFDTELMSETLRFLMEHERMDSLGLIHSMLEKQPDLSDAFAPLLKMLTIKGIITMKDVWNASVGVKYKEADTEPYFDSDE